VNICTSLDGSEKIHNKNRPWAKGNSYQKTTYWIKRIKEKLSGSKIPAASLISALVTVSKNSLKYPKEIVDEYLKWGFLGIHLRPLTYFGFAAATKRNIDYSAKEFIVFWKKAMDYIISINEKVKPFQEREARIMLQKILTSNDPGYTDLASPCGAALGQIVYNHDGNIYTCDEGRMLRDDTFLLGDVEKNEYESIVLNKKVKTMLAASCLENTTCDSCVYKPYCGICPIRNYIYYGNLFPQIKNTDWCKIKTAQFNYLFDELKDKKTREIFEKWVAN
jgi:radical SAM protein with 4Fe4S-binding SPASM domain